MPVSVAIAIAIAVAIFAGAAFHRRPIKNVRTLCFIELSLPLPPPSPSQEDISSKQKQSCCPLPVCSVWAMWACPLAIITSSVGYKTNHTTLWSPRQARIRIRMGGMEGIPLMSTANFIFLYAALLPQIRHGICCTSCVSTCHSYLLHAAFLLCLFLCVAASIASRTN